MNLNNAFSAIIYADISNHFPVFLQTSHSLKRTDTPVTFHKLIFSDTSKCRFIACLQQTDWSTLVEDQPIESVHDSFETSYLSIFDNCFPPLKYNINHTKIFP